MRLQRDSNPWPPQYRCDALSTEPASFKLKNRRFASFFPITLRLSCKQMLLPSTLAREREASASSRTFRFEAQIKKNVANTWKWSRLLKGSALSHYLSSFSLADLDKFGSREQVSEMKPWKARSVHRSELKRASLLKSTVKRRLGWQAYRIFKSCSRHGADLDKPAEQRTKHPQCYVW